MKSIKRGERLTILLIVLFLLGMVLLVARIVSQATFYMSHSHNVKLGYIYDRNGEVLFDEDATAEKYGADYKRNRPVHSECAFTKRAIHGAVNGSCKAQDAW